MEASGDRDLRAGGSPDFTDTLDQALAAGTIDLAVHSAKDLPLELPNGLTLAANPKRADPRDCLVAAWRWGSAQLPHRACVGSSSLRRRAQLLRWRPDLEVVELRGNVDSRLRRVQNGELDAAIVAAAGVRRLGRAREITRLLPLERFLPAPGQGALAVVVRAGDRFPHEVARGIDHHPTSAALVAERSFARALGGDCQLPLAALAQVERSSLLLRAEVLSPDGKLGVRLSTRGTVRDAAEIGARLGGMALRRGAGKLLPRRRR